MTILKKGSKGNEVKALQYFLGIAADGVFGRNTEKAVETYQKNNGLTADGIVGEKTWEKIVNSLSTIRLGDTNTNVHIWQAFLGINSDGVFGAKTKASTIAFQNSAGLTADGVVGKNTWYKAFLGKGASTSGTGGTKPVDYKQYDSRWASTVYTKNNTYNKKQTIRNSGCGPTAAADIIATWYDKNVTPKTLAALAVQKGYRTENSGTAWGFFKFLANKYGSSKFIETSSVATLKNALQDGALAVVSFGKSKWTKGGKPMVMAPSKLVNLEI